MVPGRTALVSPVQRVQVTIRHPPSGTSKQNEIRKKAEKRKEKKARHTLFLLLFRARSCLWRSWRGIRSGRRIRLFGLLGDWPHVHGDSPVWLNHGFPDLGKNDVAVWPDQIIVPLGNVRPDDLDVEKCLLDEILHALDTVVSGAHTHHLFLSVYMLGGLLPAMCCITQRGS